VSASISRISYNDTWEARDERATGIIQRYLSDNILLSIGNKNSAKELYDAIVKRYNETNTVTTAFHALSTLVSMKYDNAPSSKSMSDHIAAFLSSNNRLTSLGYPFPEDLLPLLLLKSILDNEDWRTLKTAITGSVPNGKKLTLSTVETKLAAHATNIQKSSDTPG